MATGITPALTSPGIGSGLDVATIVERLSAIERKPLERLQADATSIRSRISSVGRITGLVDQMKTTAAALAATKTWDTKTSTTTDNAVSATVTNAAQAGAASYSVDVDSIARTQTLVSGTIAAGTNLSGELRIETGQWSGAVPPAFVATSGGSPFSVNIASPGASLSEVRDMINRSGSPLRATIVRDASGERLSLVSTKTGVTQAVRVSVASAPAGSELSKLAYSPDNTAAPGGMSQTVAAANANVRINGIAVSSESNTIKDAIDGVDFQVTKPTTSSATVSINADNNSQRKAIDSFVSAYNTMLGAINQAINSESGGNSSLPSSKAALNALKNQARTTLSQFGQDRDTAGLDNIFEAGLSIAADGTIKVDDAKLTAALKNPEQMSALFSAGGLAKRVSDIADSATKTNGAISGTTQSLQSRLRTNEADQARMNRTLTTQRQRLLDQYQSLDTRIAGLNQLSSIISSRFG